MSDEKQLLAYMIQFSSPEALITATKKLRRQGFCALEAYTPFTIEGLDEILGQEPSSLPRTVLLWGLMGAVSAYLMQYILSVVQYPLNVGGRPYHSVPGFIPVTFELTILFAAFAAFIGFLIKCRLPQPYSPLFEIEEFSSVTDDGFFLVISQKDAQFKTLNPEALQREVGGKDVFKVF